MMGEQEAARAGMAERPGVNGRDSQPAQASPRRVAFGANPARRTNTQASGSEAAPEAAPRGRASRRESLFEAARHVLETKNIFDANVDDIVREAGVARGTFYIYFADKYDLVRALTERIVEEHVAAVDAARLAHEDRLEQLRESSLTAIRLWQRHAPIYRSVFQLAMIRDDFHELRDRLQIPLREANAAAIRREQEEGQARPDVDARVAAAAINRTYELLVMEWFGWSSPPYEGATIEGVADELAHIWYHALYPDETTPADPG